MKIEELHPEMKNLSKLLQNENTFKKIIALILYIPDVDNLKGEGVTIDLKSKTDVEISCTIQSEKTFDTLID